MSFDIEVPWERLTLLMSVDVDLATERVTFNDVREQRTGRNEPNIMLDLMSDRDTVDALKYIAIDTAQEKADTAASAAAHLL